MQQYYVVNVTLPYTISVEKYYAILQILLLVSYLCKSKLFDI